MRATAAAYVRARSISAIRPTPAVLHRHQNSPPPACGGKTPARPPCASLGPGRNRAHLCTRIRCGRAVAAGKYAARAIHLAHRGAHRRVRQARARPTRSRRSAPTASPPRPWCGRAWRLSNPIANTIRSAAVLSAAGQHELAALSQLEQLFLRSAPPRRPGTFPARTAAFHAGRTTSFSLAPPRLERGAATAARRTVSRPTARRWIRVSRVPASSTSLDAGFPGEPLRETLKLRLPPRRPGWSPTVCRCRRRGDTATAAAVCEVSLDSPAISQSSPPAFSTPNSHAVCRSCDRRGAATSCASAKGASRCRRAAA